MLDRRLYTNPSPSQTPSTCMGRTMPSNSTKVLYRGTKGMRSSLYRARKTASWASTVGFNMYSHIPLSTEGTFLSGSAPRGTIRAARVDSEHAARAARAERKQHSHHAQIAQNAQHGVLEADLEADFRHAQNA